MSHTVSKIEPGVLAAGDTWEWERSLPDYPADVWTLTYYFVGKDGRFTFAATADGTDHAVTVAKAATAAYTPGVYRGEGFVGDGTERFRVWVGELRVEADMSAQQEGFDTRSHAQKVLDAVEAVLERRATRDQESYSLGGRSLSRTPIADLIVFKNHYQWIVRRERSAARIAQGLGGGGNIHVRF